MRADRGGTCVWMLHEGLKGLNLVINKAGGTMIEASDQLDCHATALDDGADWSAQGYPGLY